MCKKHFNHAELNGDNQVSWYFSQFNCYKISFVIKRNKTMISFSRVLLLRSLENFWNIERIRILKLFYWYLCLISLENTRDHLKCDLLEFVRMLWYRLPLVGMPIKIDRNSFNDYYIWRWSKEAQQKILNSTWFNYMLTIPNFNEVGNLLIFRLVWA